uniref:Uncharacterized protein n=1 Tax=Strongyloides venezuelensis TaxID=75913 RepID=A0A0K0G627_STRVS
MAIVEECYDLTNNEVSDYNSDERITQEETMSEIFRGLYNLRTYMKNLKIDDCFSLIAHLEYKLVNYVTNHSS